jgi:uncharacterized coiled-coil DUF342 family protein
MDKKALHEELHRLTERKKELYAQKDSLYDKLSRLKSRKQEAHRRANERVSNWIFGTSREDKRIAFERAKGIGRDMDRTYSELNTLKGRLKHVRDRINELKEELFNGK